MGNFGGSAFRQAKVVPALSRTNRRRECRHGVPHKIVFVLMVILSPNASIWSCVAVFVAAILCGGRQWSFLESSESGIVPAKYEQFHRHQKSNVWGFL
jgi:hypothetical protein